MKIELKQSEEWVAKQLDKKGWSFVSPSELVPDKSQPLCLPRLRDALQRLNSGILDEEIEEAINYLRTRSFDREGCRSVLNTLKNGYAVRDKEGNPKVIRFIDYNNTEKNDFIYSRQVYYEGIKDDIPDLVLYVNGIPLVVIECKRMSKGWKKGYTQVKRYEQEVPELFKYAQFSLAVADKVVYFPNVRWLEDVRVYEWRPDPLELLEPSQLLDIIRYFLFFREEEKETTKVLPRYMQYRAVNKVVDVAVGYVSGRARRNRGLIWHWQGSGKTLEMLFGAYKLQKLLGNPTIFFVVDRIDLEGQLNDELTALRPELSFERVASASDLKKILTHADGKRGLFLTLIHKFRKDFKELVKELKEEKWGISNRRDVIAFVDEGHRTQYGDFASIMRGMLNKAVFFAFTGTPIAKRERDTYAKFGYRDQPYLDRYFILDSIKDKFTVKIAWQARLDTEHLDKEYLNTFLASKLEEIPEEFRGRVSKDLRSRLNKARVILENKGRIGKLARDIATHYTNYGKPFKAMVVAVSRLACVRYKRALDKLLPGSTEVVMTFDQNEKEKEISQFHKEWMERYKLKDDKKIRYEIRDRFKRERTDPKILIVTDMLLTGFDASILQTIYLDKLLKEHRLLQAIARTNRPYMKNGENIKAAGLIVDYVGLFKEYTKALAMYDETDIEGAAYDLDKIKKELREKIDEALKLFKGIPLKFDRPVIDKAIVRLEQDAKAEDFRKLYREIRNLYRFLLEDRMEFKEAFSWLTEVYYAHSRRVNALDPEIEQKRDRFLSEAMEFIHQSIDVDRIRKDFPVVEIDHRFLERVEKKGDKRRRFYELLFPVQNYINRAEFIGREDLVEKVNRIVERWRARQIDEEEAYDELRPVGEVFQEEVKERARLGLDENHYRLYQFFKHHAKLGDREALQDVNELMEEIRDLTFPGWWEKKDAKREVSRKVLLFLIDKYKDEVDVQGMRKDILKFLKAVRWTS